MLTIVSKFSLFFLFAALTELPSTQEKIMHPLYVSVTEINLNAKESQLEVSSKMFADDFENALKNDYKINIDINSPKDVKELEKIVFDYIQKHVQLKINNLPVSMQFVGYEKESESIWCYSQVNNVKKLNRLEIMNNLLYQNNAQMNIIHVTVNGNRKSTKLNYPDSLVAFQF